MSRTKKPEPIVGSGPVALRFIGGRRYIVGVPAADHVVDDPAEAVRLIETGLYEPVTGEQPATTGEQPAENAAGEAPATDAPGEANEPDPAADSAGDEPPQE